MQVGKRVAQTKRAWLRDTHCQYPGVIFDSELEAPLGSFGHLARCRDAVEVDDPAHQRYAAWASNQVTNVSLIVDCAWLPWV